MPELIAPTTTLQTSYLQGWAEFAAEGRGLPDDHSALGYEAERFAAAWDSTTGFAAFVDFLTESGLEETPRADDWVPQTTFWYVDADRYLGSIRVRHRLTPGLLEEGGHIGYDVRPTARLQGHATAMLAAALDYARSLGLDRVLLTCDEHNVGSRRVIEANGGMYEDSRAGNRRYWVATGR
jgi:predicted acetyltransferase